MPVASDQPTRQETAAAPTSCSDSVAATGPVLAMDIGGTKIALAVVTSSGEISQHQEVRTRQSGDPDAVYQPAAEAIADMVPGSSLPSAIRVGVSSAGPIEGPSGTVSPVNIPAWRNYPVVQRIRDTVAEVTGQPGVVRLAGDGHCMALGEHCLSVAK